MNRFTLSHDSVTCRRSPQVSSTAFDAQPPDLPPVSLMDMGFAVLCPLARHRRPRIRFLFISSPLCSTLLSGPALVPTPSIVLARFPPGGNRDSAVGARQVFSDPHLCEIGRSL